MESRAGKKSRVGRAGGRAGERAGDEEGFETSGGCEGVSASERELCVGVFVPFCSGDSTPIKVRNVVGYTLMQCM